MSCERIEPFWEESPKRRKGRKKSEIVFDNYENYCYDNTNMRRKIKVFLLIFIHIENYH